MINRVVLVGRLTRDPELKYTTNGIANLRFSIAVNRTFTSQNGERQADFINCVACAVKLRTWLSFYVKDLLSEWKDVLKQVAISSGWLNALYNRCCLR